MPYPLGDWLVERRYAVEIELQRRQDPESSIPESTPPDTATQSPAPETSAASPTSSEAPPTSAAPTSSAPPSATSTSPTSPSQSPTLPTVSETSSAPTPTDPVQSSSVSTRSSASEASTRSVVSSLSNAGSSPVITQIITSFIGTNSAGQSVVTVSYTSNYAVPTTAPSRSSQNVGAIVGGVVGGVGGLLVLLLLLWFIRRKTKKDRFEDNMFEPDRNIDRPIDLVEGDDVNDPEAIARPYHLPPSPTRPEMGMAANTRPMSMESAFTQGRPLSSDYHDALSVARPTSGGSYYAPPNPGMTMPMPMPLSRDHLAHLQSRTNSTVDHHSQPTSEALSDGGSSSARALKEREARRLHVANDDGGVVVHSDAGRVNDQDDDEPPREIPPTYESIGGPSGAR